MNEAKRRHIRFNPEPGIFALIDTDITSFDFNPEINGLVVEYNPMSGCGLILIDAPQLTSGSKCRVQIGKLPPLLVEVVWIRNLEDNIRRCGLKFIE